MESPEAVVRWMGAMQAQELAVARWSIAQRASETDDRRVNEALAVGTVLRTHVLRPTWHVVLAADIRWLMTLSAPRVHALNRYMYRQLQLDDAMLGRTNDLLAAALEGGRHLTRPEVAVHLQAAGIEANGPRLAYILMRAELDCVVCSGAPRGKQQTYALLQERAPRAALLDREAALAELTRRYFTSRGPATLKDYVTWSSLTVAEGRRGLDLVRSDLEQFELMGRSFWYAPHVLTQADQVHLDHRSREPTIDLVQGYDEIVMSYRESRDALLAPPEGIPEGPPYLHAVLLNGRLIGHWRPVTEKRQVTIETYFYRPLSRVEARSLEAAVQRYRQFAGVPVALA